MVDYTVSECSPSLSIKSLDQWLNNGGYLSWLWAHSGYTQTLISLLAPEIVKHTLMFSLYWLLSGSSWIMLLTPNGECRHICPWVFPQAELPAMTVDTAYAVLFAANRHFATFLQLPVHLLLGFLPYFYPFGCQLVFSFEWKQIHLGYADSSKFVIVYTAWT